MNCEIEKTCCEEQTQAPNEPGVEAALTKLEEKPAELPTYVPSANAWERSDGLELEVELPGIPAAALSVNYEDGVLSIEGEPLRHHEGRRSVRKGLGHAKALRRFRLDDELDPESIEAEYKHGLLKLRIARRPAAKARRITIRS